MVSRITCTSRKRFERLLEAHRRSDGSMWTGQQLDEATGGVMTRSYFVNLQKVRIENPGYEKMRAIAKAMGFPSEAWFNEGGGTPIEPTGEDRGIAGRVEHLFEAFSNPKTGRLYTSAEVARLAPAGLSEKDVEGIRTGAVADPAVSQVVALAGVFGVEPSYLLDRGEPLFDGELVEALRDGTVREAALELSRLSERERRLILGIVRQFENSGEPPSSSLEGA